MIIGHKLGIGRFPGIGVGKINIEITFEMDAIIFRMGLKTFTCDTHICSLPKTDTFTCDTHILTGTYTETFTMDCEILKGIVFTMDTRITATHTETFECDVRVSTTGIEQFTFDTTTTKSYTKTFNIDAMVQKQNLLKTFVMDSRIATGRSKTFTIQSNIASVELETFNYDANIAMSGLTETFTIDTDIANFKTTDIRMDCILFKFPKYVLNGYDITNNIKTPDISGLLKKTNTYSAPYQIINKIIDMGTENLKYDFELKFTNIGEYDDFLTVVNSNTRDIIFYPGRDDIFQKVKSVSVTPLYIFHGMQYRPRVILELEDPYLYSVHVYQHTMGTVASGFITNPFGNDGTVDTPFEKMEITGVYSGSHLTNAVVYLMDGATEESYIVISDKLLSNEVASLDIYGDLKCSYSDDFLTTTKYNVDKYASSGATCSGGKVTIASGGYLTYKFSGPHPVRYNSKLVATLNAVAGSPIIQVSSDNLTWNTAVLASQIVNNIETEYFINGSEKLGDFYVRFYCPSGATLDIFDIDFETYRDTTYWEIPIIESGETRTLKVIGSGSGIAGFDFIFRSRKWP